MKPTSQLAIPAPKPEVDRVMIDTTHCSKDPKGKPITTRVRYVRVGQISEREAIARGYEHDEFMDRRERIRRAKLAAVSGVNEGA